MPEAEEYTITKNGIKRRKRRLYTDEFKRQIVNLYKAGHSRNHLMQEYNLTASSLDRWIREDRNSGSFHAKDNRTPEENELIFLRKQNKQLLMENDILKQAALIFGRKGNQK